MANNKDFIVKNAVEVGGATKVTVGDAATGGSYTAGYSLASAAYDSKSFSVSTQESTPRASAFKSDGTKMYVVGSGSNAVYQYSLSTAWDVSTASYDSKSASVGTQTSNDTRGLAFKTDGTKMYVASEATKYVYQYSLSTAWDVSTATYDSVSFYVNSQDIYPQDVLFKTDGTKMYMVGYNTDAVYQYDLTTAWDISTASYASKSLSTSAQDPTGAPISADFSSDGTSVFVLGLNTDTVFQYNLSTAWDISTATYSSTSFSVTSQDATPLGVQFGNDGQKMYIAGNTNNTIYQYSTGSTVTTGSFDLSTGNYFTDTPSADVEYTFSNAGDVQSFQLEVTGAVKGYELSGAAYDSVFFDASTQETECRDLFFKPDGTKMYIIGQTGDDVNEYSLSTAWDLSTATYTTAKSVSAQDTGPQSIIFKSDGTKMYMSGINTDAVYEYDLSTAWDVSTATYSNVSFSFTSQTSFAGAIDFKQDGTKLYMAGADNYIYQYSLSTAWDVSTLSYDSVSFDVSSEAYGLGISFSSDGTKMFTSSTNTDLIYQYDLSTAWDLSSASYSNINLNVGTQDGFVNGITFNNDGTKFYIIGRLDKVHQYTTGTAITVTWDADIAWPSGTAPDSPAAGEKDIYTFTTDDGGTTYIGVQSGDAFS